MAKRNRERAKQAKRKAKEERKAQREADKLNRPTELALPFNMAIETLILSEEARVREIGINDSNGVILIQRSHKLITSFFDRPHMARGNVTCCTY